ncbi:MAG TPA: methyltransferase domain-containing protein [Vicinamibacterales bacterium]|nr:methyltransferase domain-containing protein [Vicinamibacterales bacterium]
MSNLLPRLEFGLQALVQRQRQCPFCRGVDHRVVAKKHLVVRVRKCVTCNLYFTDPIYKSRLGDLYDSLYNAEGLTTQLPDGGTLRTLKATRFGTSDKNCARQLVALEALEAGPRLLEIGSSWGYFLYQARAVGFDPIGVEPARTRREYGVRELGVDIRPSIGAVAETGFDIVYSAHTLEHLTDAHAFFASCHERLRSGGVLAIEVPHFDLEALGANVLSIIGAVHPLGLSRPFFETALPRTGFACVGMFDAWTGVPNHPSRTPSEGNLIVIARKLAERPQRRIA